MTKRKEAGICETFFSLSLFYLSLKHTVELKDGDIGKILVIQDESYFSFFFLFFLFFFYLEQRYGEIKRYEFDMVLDNILHTAYQLDKEKQKADSKSKSKFEEECENENQN